MTQEKLSNYVAIEIVVIFQDFEGFIFNNVISFLRNSVKYFFENKWTFPLKEIQKDVVVFTYLNVNKRIIFNILISFEI